MATELRCGEMFPGCEWVGRAETEEEVLAKGAEHAAEVHGLKEIDEDTEERVRAAIRDV